MIDGFCIIKEDDIVHVVPVGECPGGGGGGVVDGQILYDDNHIESLDAGERYVKDSAGTTHIDWSQLDRTAYHRPIYIYGTVTERLILQKTTRYSASSQHRPSLLRRWQRVYRS